jgi:hypothetical protein
MAVRKAPRKKTAGRSARPPGLQSWTIEQLEESNPHKMPREARGIPVLVGLELNSPVHWTETVEIDLNDQSKYNYTPMHGNWINFKFAWNKKGKEGGIPGDQQEAEVSIEDGELFMLLKDHITVTEKRKVPATESKVYAAIPIGVLPEDCGWVFEKGEKDEQKPASEVSNA